ncbi:MAG: acyl-CoA dehydrogenase C-terminal domain-containing protein [Pseudomonadales bacterium]|jgi:alkylation response protein AidB-like acyl-CoA dehydrogenase|nr:acyl-CoA dehydrogenase C-terminal domain-containing protein [Pseudomonadales bacterium]
MLSYKAPLRDMRFVRDELLGFPALFAALPGCEEFTPDLVEAILAEAAKFCEEVLAPLYRSGDEEGCTWTAQGVRVPAGFREAYAQYVEGGWAALSSPPEYGGQGLPPSINLVVEDMLGTANWAWAMYPGLSHGATRTIKAHGTEEQKRVYLPKLVSGEWTGTMCLTEAHAGSDLGMLRTRAEPHADGSYRITGTKIFISAGDHDLAQNIVHIVLARLPDAPPGTKGISLFLVPKRLPQADGSLVPNSVSCGSIEHKMGINASATCVMNFDAATGFLIGEPNRGLNHMFTFMNAARLGTAMQGLAAAELSFQGALAYARERLQGRSLSGPKNAAGPADPLIVHPNIRRMLLTQKAYAEGSRAFLYWLCQLVDIADKSADAAARKQAEDLMALLTPVAKAFVTEAGYEAANLGVQVFGGHGYVREHGMEQIVRDTRIALIYEGTSAIQALDLLGRKIMGSGGELLRGFAAIVEQFCAENAGNADMAPLVAALTANGKRLEGLTMHIAGVAMKNPDEADAAAFEYLMFIGYFVLGFMWARMARTALDALAGATDETDFYRAKIETARFYFQRILPRTESLALCVEAGGATLMALPQEHFAL